MTDENNSTIPNEDGYDLWLRYKLIDDIDLLDTYRSMIKNIVMDTHSPTLQVAYKELSQGLLGLLGKSIPLITKNDTVATLVSGISLANAINDDTDLTQVRNEGYVIISNPDHIIITANTDVGILYGVFAFLRLLQTHQPIENLHIVSAPKLKLRMLNHWDNLDGTIERGYAGNSLWDWHKLPYYVEPRYTDYARACASIGINATVITSVNASALILTDQYLHKAEALAKVFRPYGLQVFLTARFSAPMEIGGLDTADPLNPDVATWWKNKITEIYQILPDFGGFVVKANSEGQPGPHDYGLSHADGANMLADALEPHGGLVIWRAFVYDADVEEDRFKQANTQLVPQDGTFRDNAVLQVKNGPIDFQPRESYHPLFGAMPKTPLMLEVQITQEYLGCATHLAYLAPLFKETLDSDTYCQGAGSTVAKIVDGSLDGHAISGMAGVTNIGNDRNWCGHPFGAGNWYAYGRLAWDYDLSSEQIAEEWLRMTFSNDANFVATVAQLMSESRDAVVDYMMPMGLHHLFERGHHYGPGPWVDGGRPDWTSLYYHQADTDGIGFDRTASGSNAISLYHSPYSDQMEDLTTCPDEFLLWFHHVRWDYKTQSERSVWDELCFRYNRGVETVRGIQKTWDSLEAFVDSARFLHVKALLILQEREACWWRDACLLYFQTFSGMPIPSEYEQPEKTLDYYINLKHYYVPGIPERRFNNEGSGW